jgi:integrative and conjugative element protein (TIGR02256 family)
MQKQAQVAPFAEISEPTESYKEYVWLCEGHRLAISEKIYTRLLTFRQLNNGAMESGGFVVGRRISGTQTSVADEISTPMVEDSQTQFTFFRNNGHVNWLKKYWEETRKTGQLLATWHTHPETKPNPSSTDYDDWRNVVKKCAPVGVPIYFVIVGQEEVKVWRGLKRKFARPTISQCSFEGILG